jgi:hypothetical protein
MHTVKAIEWNPNDGNVDNGFQWSLRTTNMHARWVIGNDRHPIIFRENVAESFGLGIPDGFKLERALKGLCNIDCRVIGDKLPGLGPQFLELCLFLSVTLDVYERHFTFEQNFINDFRTGTIPADRPVH